MVIWTTIWTMEIMQQMVWTAASCRWLNSVSCALWRHQKIDPQCRMFTLKSSQSRKHLQCYMVEHVLLKKNTTSPGSPWEQAEWLIVLHPMLCHQCSFWKKYTTASFLICEFQSTWGFYTFIIVQPHASLIPFALEFVDLSSLLSNDLTNNFPILQSSW